MGAYYAKQLEKLVGWQTHFEASRAAKNPIMSPEEYQKGLDQAAESYPFHVDAGKDRAVELVVECLRFQDWKAKSAYTDA